jgi:ABC-type cobalamin/Fe3+-siderophores transport system ATPase subunit
VPEDVRPMVLRADGVRVGPAARPMLATTTLEVHTGRVHVAVGDPGHGHTALALALAGRLHVDQGSVSIDGETRPARLQRVVGLVDVPGVSEPDGNVPLATVVGEELAMAGRRPDRAAVRAWLEERGLADLLHSRVDQVPPLHRTRVLAELAAQRPGVRFLVATMPERHGHGPAPWALREQALADLGFGVLITASRVGAAALNMPTSAIGLEVSA